MAQTAGKRAGVELARITAPGGARAAAKVAAKAARAAFRRVAGSLPVTRELPIQKSVDIAVPVDVAWDEWMSFEFLPEGTHRVADVERDGDKLTGSVGGSDWEAEILDERIDESFAWHSVGGSDCSGLVTFHELGDRLTRIELHVDVIPGGVSDSVAMLLRVADRRAEAELRRFKAHVEALDPDDYPPAAGDADGAEQ